MNWLVYSLSAFVLVLIGSGIALRRKRKWHIRLMLSAFVIDIGLILVVEFSRQAVEKVVSLDIPLFTWIHVLISVSVVVLYGALIVLGIKLLKGREAARPWHRKLAMAFVVFRVANFLTSLGLPFQPF